MKNDIYTLPEDIFVAGRTRNYSWDLYNDDGTPFDCEDFTGNFALSNYSSVSDTPVVSKSVTFDEGSEGVLNVVKVTLLSSDTINLDGKYVYQLTVKGTNGVNEIPDQGILYIYKNINKAFITS